MLLYGNMASRLDKCYAAFGINIYHRRIPQDYAIEHRQDHGLLVMPVSLIFTFSTWSNCVLVYEYHSPVDESRNKKNMNSGAKTLILRWR